MHAVIRRYRVRLGSMEEAVRYLDKWYLPLVRRIPGFVACHVMGEEERVLTTMGLFDTAPGAEAATELARDWFGKEWGPFRALPPEVIGGRVMSSAGRPPSTDRRHLPDRRSGLAEQWAGDRRSGERRAPQPEPALVELRAAG